MRFYNMLPLTDETCYFVRHLVLQPNSRHNIMDDDLAEVLPGCPNLTAVNFTGVLDLSDRSLALLSSNAMALTSVNVSGCHHITNVGVISLGSHASSLGILKLNRVPLLTDPAISAIVISLAHLVELEICELPLITAVSVRDIWVHGKQLRRLRMARCTQLTDKAFPCAFLPSPISPRVNRRTPSVSRHHSTGSSGRPATWLEALPPLILPASHCLKELRLLDLTYCYKLTDIAIVGLISHAPRIQCLYLSGCLELTDVSLESISILGSHLDVLTLAHVDKVTDKGISILCRGCTRMRSIDISYCSLLTDLSVLELGSSPELSRFSITHVPSLTDNAVFFLAEHAAGLLELHISHCPLITLEAFHVLISRHPRLEHLHASGIPSLRRRGVKQFSEPTPPGYDRRLQGLFRIFKGSKLGGLRDFLDKEEIRRKEAERFNILFFQRSDSKTDLY